MHPPFETGVAYAWMRAVLPGMTNTKQRLISEPEGIN